LRSLAREPLRREAAQKLKQIDIRDAKLSMPSQCPPPRK
jgi:hypothetical protein